MRWFVVIWLCCAGHWALAQSPIRAVQAFGNTPIDKLALVHDQLWAAGDGSVFVYKNSKWSSPFKKNEQGEVFAIGAITTAAITTAPISTAPISTAEKYSPGPGTDLGVVCFARDRGLCTVYDIQRNLSFNLNENMPMNYAARGSLLALFQHHGKGAPLLFATNQNTTTINEVPLQLVQLSNEGFLAKLKNDVNKLNFESYLAKAIDMSDSYSIRFRGWRSPFPPIHYLYSFQLNGFVYVVTVQPLVDSARLRFETRIARFCLDDFTMTTYSEVPVRCKTEHNVFDLAVHARLVNHSNRFMLFMSMGKTEKSGRFPDPQEKSAICVFDVEDMGKKFESAADECNNGADRRAVRKLKYYQENRESGPLVCEQSPVSGNACNRNLKNKYIVSMTEYEGKVVFSNQRKNPPDVTYIYKATRTTAASVGVLTAFEVDPPESSSSGKPLFFWALDHLGQLHRILYIQSHDSMPTESMLLASVPRPNAKYGFEAQSIHFEGRSMFLVDKNLIETNTGDPCSLYLNCGDCINPLTLTHNVVNCFWRNNKCVAAPEGKQNDAICKPTVIEKGPFSGPQRGGTRFKIRGFDLGIREDTAQVNFGSQKCKIIQWDNLTGTCEVPPDRDQKTKVDITLYVNDLRIDHRMKTFHIASEVPEKIGTFTYYSVQFYGVFPSFGPRIGGTQLRIVGQNIGQSGPQAQYGLFGSGDHLICKDFVVRNDSELLCNTTELGAYAKEKRSLNLTLKIDGVAYDAIDGPDFSQVFVYQPDPVKVSLSSASRLNFFAWGCRNFPIVFSGEHLDAGAFPKLLVRPLGFSNHLEANCLSNFTTVSCQAPPLTGMATSLSQPLPATATLKIDNFIFEDLGFRVTYYPNATILLTDGEKFIIDSDGPTKIAIKGKNLLPLEKDQVKIFLNNKDCTVGDIDDTTIECSSDDLRAGDYSVEVDIENRKYSALMSTIVTTGRGLGWGSTAAIVISCLIVLIALTFLILRFVPLRKKIIEAEPTVTYTPENDGYLHPDNERLLTTIPSDPEMIHLLSEEGLLMDFSCIRVGALIGKGQFGCVYRGILKRDKLSEEEQVAVKTLQQRAYPTNDPNVFLKEALRMKDFNHQNVLRLIGVSFDNNNSADPMIIVPYMANGDLLTYIRNQENKPTVKDLITFGANIALGMSYLTTQKFVHRDLAARNCMLGLDLIVRVADFGLSRDVYETSYYSSDNSKTKLPVKWMAIESLVEGVYSHRSDVWSYGVVLWELMTRGCVPYPNVDNWDIQNWLKAGRRMLQPNFCPDALYEIMMTCWDEDPKKRPTFSQLVKDVPNVIHTIEIASRNQVPNYVNV